MVDRWTFRGKARDTGEWIVGDLQQVGHKVFIDDDRVRARVYPETVGQCTGYKDCGWKPVFEGDVCKFEIGIEKLIGKIVYNPKACAFEMRNNVVVGAYGEEATHTRLLCHCDKIDVIGNIHDSPGLPPKED